MDKKGQWGQLGEEIKNDFIKMIIILGIILGSVLIFRMWAASPWLLVLLMVVGLAMWGLYAAMKRGLIRI